MLVHLVKHPNFYRMHIISYFSQIVFDEFIARGEILHKVDRTLANRVVERRNMIIPT
jgi:hypothetical protein